MLLDSILEQALDSIHDIDLTQDPETVRQQMRAILVKGISDFVKTGQVTTPDGTFNVF